MSFSKQLYYKLFDQTPSDLALALATAFEATNGPGRTFVVREIGYTLPDGTGFHSGAAKLSDLQGFPRFPPDFAIVLSAKAAGDPKVEYVTVRIFGQRFTVYVKAQEADAIQLFGKTFCESLNAEQTNSTFHELGAKRTAPPPVKGNPCSR